MTQFVQGFKFTLSGFSLLFKPGIRFYVIIPLLINTLLFTAAIYFGASSLNDFINSLVAEREWLGWFTWLLWPLFIIIACTIIFFGFSIIANLIGAPFNGFLAEAVEKVLTDKTVINENNLPILQIIRDSMKSEAQKLLYFVIRALPLLLLFVIPMVQVAAPMLWFLFSAWMLSIEYSDYPMGNHDILFADQRKVLASKRGLVFGFGAGVMLLTMIPILNFIAMPVAVIGATKMYLEHFKTAAPALTETAASKDN